jgi:hypothetical protein
MHGKDTDIRLVNKLLCRSLGGTSFLFRSWMGLWVLALAH